MKSMIRVPTLMSVMYHKHAETTVWRNVKQDNNIDMFINNKLIPQGIKVWCISSLYAIF